MQIEIVTNGFEACWKIPIFYENLEEFNILEHPFSALAVIREPSFEITTFHNTTEFHPVCSKELFDEIRQFHSSVAWLSKYPFLSYKLSQMS